MHVKLLDCRRTTSQDRNIIRLPRKEVKADW